MKRLILVSAMILGLGATGVLASQNKNTAKPKPAATSNSGTMSGGGKHHRRHHRRHHKGGKSTGNMASSTPKTKNK